MRSKTEALHALIGRIEPGWTVHTMTYDSRNSTGWGTVESVTAVEIRTRLHDSVRRLGRPFATSRMEWPTREDDFDVDGNTLRFYSTPPPHTGKPRRLIKTKVFHPAASD